MGQSPSRYVEDPRGYATEIAPPSSNVVSVADASDWKTYDYVVIGGGTAGCVLASRLSEDRNSTVLVIEAGKSHDANFWTRIPFAFAQLLGSAADWDYQTTPQGSLNGRALNWPRGKILGGSSSINALLYQRCDPADYDAWERQGASGWGCSVMKKYLHKVEAEGPCIELNSPLAPISHEFLQATQKLGIPPMQWFQDSDSTGGAGVFPTTIQSGHSRSSSATAYLTESVLSRPNLTVALSAYTERILFSQQPGDDPRAIGIQVSQGHAYPKFAVRADREVILCAGAIGTPQLLLISGVGPSAQLEQHGIVQVRELPAVGQGLLDHLSCGSVILRARPGWTWDRVLQDPLRKTMALLQWLFWGKGPLTGVSAQVGAFTRIEDSELSGITPPKAKDSSSGPRAPVLETVMFPIGITEGGRGLLPIGSYGITMSSILLKPFSTGSVTLRSGSVYDHPLIDPNYLKDEDDMDALVKGVRFLLRLARTPPLCHALKLANLRSAPSTSDHYWPGDADPDEVADDELRAFIRNEARTTFHPTSSAKMGVDTEKSVVDNHLCVHGIHGLRVVDASVFPDQVSGHPCGAVLAVAEHAADIIRGTHELRSEY